MQIGGVLWNDASSIELARALQNSKCITLIGIYTHEGNSYGCKGQSELHTLGNTCCDRLLEFAKRCVYIVLILIEIVRYIATLILHEICCL